LDFLRHDYVTARRDRGDSFEEIQQALDHEFVATTRGYDHEHYERMKKAALDVECAHLFPMPPV
jgi:site-specific recombinase XerD